MRQLLLALLVAWAVSAAAAAPTTLDITVPESVKVEGEDSYICITKPLPDKPLKLVGVEPMAKQEVVHHILLFGECMLFGSSCHVLPCWAVPGCAVQLTQHHVYSSIKPGFLWTVLPLHSLRACAGTSSASRN